jgi:hypothetical protein
MPLTRVMDPRAKKRYLNALMQLGQGAKQSVADPISQSLIPTGAPQRLDSGTGPTMQQAMQQYPEGFMAEPPQPSRLMGDVPGFSAMADLLGAMLTPSDDPLLDLEAGGMVSMGRQKVLQSLGLSPNASLSESALRKVIEDQGPEASAGAQAYLKTRDLQKAATSTDTQYKTKGVIAQDKLDAERAARETVEVEVMDPQDLALSRMRDKGRIDFQREIFGSQPEADEFGRPNFPRTQTREVTEKVKGGGEKTKRVPTQHYVEPPFANVEGERRDIGLPHGATGDGMSNAFARARQDYELGRRPNRLPTNEEIESWIDVQYAKQGKKMPDDVRKVFMFHEPSELVDITKRALRDGDVRGIARTWYNDFHNAVAEVVGANNMEEFSGVWALLSPQNSVENNLRDAISAMRFGRQYDDAVKRAGREWDENEFVGLYARTLRNVAAGKVKKGKGEISRMAAEGLGGRSGGETLLGTLGKTLEETSTTFPMRANVTPRFAPFDEKIVGIPRSKVGMEQQMPEGTQVASTLHGQISPDEAARKVFNFYDTGHFEGSLKTKSFFLTTLEKARMGAAGTATNDVRVGAFFGQPKMFEVEGYEAAQQLAAEVSREVSDQLGVRVTTDEVQAIWWLLGESPTGAAVHGGLTPHPSGSLESAMAFAKDEMDMFTRDYGGTTGERFAKKTEDFTMQQHEGAFPLTRESFRRATEAQMEDLPSKTMNVVQNLGKEATEAGERILQELRELVWARTGLKK